MNTSIRNALRDYFECTVNRYYTPEEKQRLIPCFSSLWGLEPMTADTFRETVEHIEGYAIRTHQECGVFLLCHTEEDETAEALEILFSVLMQADPPKWKNLFAWRREVFDRHAEGGEAAMALEQARIHVAEGQPADALLALRAHSDLESLRYRTLLHEMTDAPGAALYHLLWAERVARERLRLTPACFDADFDGHVHRLASRLTPGQAEQIRQQVDSLDIQRNKPMRPIGFT